MKSPNWGEQHESYKVLVESFSLRSRLWYQYTAVLRLLVKTSPQEASGVLPFQDVSLFT